MQLNLPNTLTFVRIALVVPMVVLMLLPDPQPWRMFGATALFLLASLTDFLDGYLARSRNQVTDLGKLLDPIADKLLVCSALVALVELGNAPAWAVVVILGREFAVSGMRSFAAAKGYVLAARVWGKLKMVAQIVAVTLLMLELPLAAIVDIAPLARYALWVAVALAAISLYDYATRFAAQIGAAAR